MIIRCSYCLKEKENNRKYGTNFCDDCLIDKEIGIPITVEKRYLPSYGYASLKQIDEVKRRRILPYEREGNSYYVGRMGENGKIQEKEPAY